MIGSAGAVTVAVAGTPEVATKNLPNPTKPLNCNVLFIQALNGNSGKAYIGAQGMSKSTMEGVYLVVPVPAAGNLPLLKLDIPGVAGPINLAQVYVDVDTSGQGVLIAFGAI